MASGKLSVLTAALLLGVVPAVRADVSISNKPTSNMSCSAGVCTATAQKAVLNAGDLQTMLANGDVAVKTGTMAKDIDIDQPLTWSSTGRLTLDAQQSVTIKKPVLVAATGALTITTNDGGSGGDLLFDTKGSATFSDKNSSLVINGQSFTLVRDITTLAADIAANPSGSYALANSYDAKHDRFDTVPIPTTFAGIFEGLGQTISHLKINHGQNRREGFFAYISGVVRDVNVTKSDVRSSKDLFAGVLAGTNTGVVANVSVDGTVQVTGTAGGLVGENDGMIINTSAAVEVTTSHVAGGLAGSSVNGSIESSHSTGTVVGNTAGGLVGTGSNIVLSYATGSVRGGDDAGVGGLVGVGDHIDQSYALGTVVGGSYGTVAGGLVGNGSFISNSYATGAVQVGSRKVLAGGLVGYATNITTSYSTGTVIAGKGSYVGGLLGRGDRHSSFGYWDTDTSGNNVGCGKGDCIGVTGLSTQQLQSQLPVGFDPHIWRLSADFNNGFPYLRANYAR